MSQNEVQALNPVEAKLAEGVWHEALARITPGLVHDVNNCLAGILSTSENCLVLSDRQQSFREELTLIKDSSLASLVSKARGSAAGLRTHSANTLAATIEIGTSAGTR